jgi:hypothetical protein
MGHGFNGPCMSRKCCCCMISLPEWMVGSVTATTTDRVVPMIQIPSKRRNNSQKGRTPGAKEEREGHKASIRLPRSRGCRARAYRQACVGKARASAQRMLQRKNKCVVTPARSASTVDSKINMDCLFIFTNQYTGKG